MSDPADNAVCGTWPSPIGAGLVARGSTSIGEPRLLGETLYWLESRPEEGGRTTLLARPRGQPVAELTRSPWDVRSRVHEYGGGAYVPTPHGTCFVNCADQDIYLIGSGRVRRLTRSGVGERCASLTWDHHRERLLMVTERHAAGQGEPRNALEALPLDGSAAPRLQPLHGGHDFYGLPRLSDDGRRLAFIAWDHPNMPWDGSELRVLELTADGRAAAETLVAGGAAESVLHPVWMADGGLVFASDSGGFWNLYRYDDSGVYCLLADAAEYATPLWGLGQTPFVRVGSHHLAAVRQDGPERSLLLIDTRSGFATPLPADPLPSEWTDLDGLCAGADALYYIGYPWNGPATLVRQPLNGRAASPVATARLPEIDGATLSRPEPLTCPTRDGAAVHAWYYPPRHPTLEPRPDERPPLLVKTHGGPTGQTSAALDLRVQYFTSRGFAVLDVDYRGSSGYGRDYREALRGRWGILEVEDCEDAVAWLIARALVDPARICIRGGSAGGFTTLSALTRSALFRAGASYYGVADLEALARQTHKFESRYLHTLAGDAGELRRRSPIHRLSRLQCPVIFFQGAQDRVVPADQAREMVAALRRHRRPVAYLEFDGEGHGFRRAEHIERALNCEHAFYCRVLGLQGAPACAELEIENL